MKLIKLLTLTTALFAVSFTLHAQESFKAEGTEACEGFIQTNDDSTKVGWKNLRDRNKKADRDVACCPVGTRLSGLTITKTRHDKNEPDIKAIAPFCRRYGDSKPDALIETRDNTRHDKDIKVTIACNTNEIVSGFVWKDGKKSDDMATASPICYNPGTGKSRTPGSADLATASGSQYTTSINLPNRSVGIAYFEDGFDIDSLEVVVLPNAPIIKK